jgi:hypothetical protein
MAGEPTPQAVIRAAIDSALLELHTAIPARVEKFDDAANTVDALPVVKRRVPSRSEGTIAEKLPTIYDVPVAWPGSGSVWAKWQIPKGSTVLLIFNEACIAQWRDTGQVSEPGDLARHDLSYPYALPIRGPTEGPGAVDATLTVEAPEIKLGASAEELVALSNLVNDNFSALKTWLDTHVHPTGMGPSGAPASPAPDPDDVACSKVKAE